MESARIEHLKLIQAVISRMAGNLFYLKGWSITVVAALFAMSAKDTNPYYVLVAYIPAVVFWILDGYFLAQERLFRDLYNHIATNMSEPVDFSMDTTPFRDKERNKWWNCMFSKTLLLFYMPFMAIMLIAMCVIRS